MSTIHQTTFGSGAMSGRRLVDHLNSLVTNNDLGALALLRRALGRNLGETPEIYAHALPYLGTVGGARRMREEDAALLIVSLFALWHQGKAVPRSAEHTSLGKAFRLLMDQSGSTSIEQRFIALLRANNDQLPNQLRHAIALLRAKDIPLDWALLFSDLCQWDQEGQRARHSVRRSWARDFWERPTEPEEAEVGGENATTDGDDEIDRDEE